MYLIYNFKKRIVHLFSKEIIKQIPQLTQQIHLIYSNKINLIIIKIILIIKFKIKINNKKKILDQQRLFFLKKICKNLFIIFFI